MLAQFGQVYQRPLGRTLQLRRAFERTGMNERMMRIVILSGMRCFVCKIDQRGSGLP